MKARFDSTHISGCILPLFMVCMLLYGNAASAQQQDAVGWATLSAEKKINQHVSVTFLNQYVFNQNVAELGLFFFDGGINYRLNNHIAVSANYRFIQVRNRDNFYNNRQQWYLDLSFSKGIGRFWLNFRSRYQQQFYGLSFTDNYKPNSYYSRNKLTLRYKISWYYSLLMSEELFYRLANISGFDAHRTSIGISRQLNLHHRLEFSYALQQQMNQKNKRTDFITGITYYYKF